MPYSKRIFIYALVPTALAGGFLVYWLVFNNQVAIETTLPNKTTTPRNYYNLPSQPAVAVKDIPTPAVPSAIAVAEPPIGSEIILNVPFTSQAPSANWQDLRQQDGCEEASALMAVLWAEGRMLTPAEAEQEIIAISEYELATYGEYRETSVQDTAERILKGYFKYNNFEIKYNITAGDIKKELDRGRAVVVPLDGQKLINQYYTPPGPRDHMLVIQGYDPATSEFITNDPGTKRGEKFRYKEADLENALRDYPTGNHEPILQIVKAMISIDR